MPSDKFQQFLANIYAHGNARANKFLVEITPPPKLGVPLESLRQLSFTTETVNIPSQTIATSELKINGLPIIPIPSQFSFGNSLDITFNLSEDYRERNIFTLWQNLVYSVGGKGFNYYNDYVGQIVVKPLKYYSGKGEPGNDDTPALSFIFRNCFPTALQELSYNWGTADKLAQGVTFSFFSMETQVRTGANYDLQSIFPDLFGSDGGFPIPPSGDSLIPLLARFGLPT